MAVLVLRWTGSTFHLGYLPDQIQGKIGNVTCPQASGGKVRLGYIGTGAMSGAIARGIKNSSSSQTEQFFFNVNRSSAEMLAAEVNGHVVTHLAELVRVSDIIILAVKPHVQKLILQQMARNFSNSHPPALLSIAAGRSLEDIVQDLVEAGVETVPPIIRVMPNVNARIGESMSAICYSPEVDHATRESAKAIFDSVGQCIELSESLFGVFTALAGSSPAWFFQIIEDLARAGVKHGMTKQQSVLCVAQAMAGSAKMIQTAAQENTNPSAMIDQVCSPGGTTIAGLLAAQESGLGTALVKAVDATVARDSQLG